MDTCIRLGLRTQEVSNPVSRETETHTEKRDGGLRTDSEPLHRTVQGQGFELDRGGRGVQAAAGGGLDPR